MKKRALCIDRIHDERLQQEEREPACAAVCPARACHFGDLADPEGPLARLVAEWGGVELLAEFGPRPTDRWAPPRPLAARPPLVEARSTGGFLGWIDRLLGG